MTPKKRIGIWLRVSTDMQVKDDSPEHHEQRARYYSEAKDWEIAEVYRLDAVSGKSVMGHPETQRMLSHIKNGHITGLVFSKLARLARNTKELLEFADIFRKEGADLISLSENIDTSTPAGRLFFTIISAMAEWEREEIASRVAASVPIRAKLNKPLGGQAPFGYRWENGVLVIEETEAVPRRLMYTLFVEHKRKGTVADLLNKQGFRTRGGAKFSDTTISRLLTDPMAKGQRRANYTKSLGDGKMWVRKPQSEWVLLPCPAIISEDLWDQCQHILAGQSKPRKQVSKKPVHLFTNLIFCICGSRMSIPSNSKKYVCPKCRKSRIEAIDLEEIYFEQLKSFLLTKEHLATYISKADTAIKGKTEEISSLNQRLKKIREDMDKLVDLHLSGNLPKEGFGDRYNPLNEQAKQITSTLPDLQAEIDYLKMQSLNSSYMLSEAQTLCDRWPQSPIAVKRTIIEQVTDAITMSPEEISIKFNYTPLISGNEPESQHNFRGSLKPPA